MGSRAIRAAWPAVLLAAAVLAVAALAHAAEGDAADDDDEPKHEKDYEGAIGLVGNYGAAFPGSSDLGVKVQPGGFLRWGRITITGAGGFTTRRNDDVERGLAAEVLRRRTWRLSLGLRYDDGRSESDSDDLAGMGSIPQTMRGRVSLRWDPVPEWRYGLTATFDLLNRVGGVTVDAGVSRRWFFGPDRFFALSATLGAADAKYMQAWHGVTDEQSANSGYAPYHPQAGLRNVGLGAIWREELSDRWTGFVSASVGRLLGPAADSPLTRKLTGGGVQAGIAWRF